MACFACFKNNPKGARDRSGAPATPPATTTASSFSTSRSDDSAAGRRWSRSTGSTASQKSIPALYEERGHKLRAFELDELRNATNDFSRMNKIGEEVQFLGVFEHPNLVKLLGYCAQDDERGIERLLVYEFMPNKSLEDHLFSRAYPPLPWNLRLQIALGVAEGLEYLHEGEVQVIYRDFKASNVLLDKDFKPKLSDFGLAREGPTAGHTHVTTAVVGTYGYAAPDYIETGHLTIKSDVWSFGVVLYEILTGRRSLERNRPPNEQKLLDWVRQFPVETRKFSMIMDPKLRNEFSLESAREIAKLANRCLIRDRKERPSMSEVIKCLRRAIQMEPRVEEPSLPTNSDRRRIDAVSSRR
ncbi:hypothetical protein GW17_00024099 [Ensete ventricosum]|nr:hypothetical protein GW17_00024099 [Ensete ventricosum]RZR93518.1 hypothetical protein BHM03_00022064 [Ensete ventricosum]